MSWSCPEKGTLLCQGRRCQKEKDTSLNNTGSVDDQYMKNILLDTGCSRTMVKKRQVLQVRILEGKIVYVLCAHGDTELYPSADIRDERGSDGRRQMHNSGTRRKENLHILLENS